MRQKKWKERIGGNPGLVIIGAFIVLSIVLAAEHLFNLPQLLSGTPPEQFEWGELVFDIVAIFCIGLISFTLVRKSEAERSEIEQIQRRERDKGQEYLDIAGVILLALNAEQKVTLINRKGCKILGYKEEEIIGKNWFDHFLPEWERERVRATFIRLMPGGHKEAEYFENPILTKSGEERIIAWHDTLLTDETGNITGTLSSGEDITERKKAEEELIRLSAAVKMSNDGIVIFDLEGKIVDINEAALKMYQTEDKNDFIGKNYLNFIAPAEQDRALAGMEEILQKGSVKNREFNIITCKGDIISVEINTALMKDVNGKPIGLVGTIRDITERKKSEEALRENEERLKLVLEGAELGYWDQNMKTREVVRNRRWAEMLGYTLEEIDSHADAWKELIHPDDLPIVNRVVEDHEAGRTPFFKCEHRMRTKSGEWKWILNCGKIIQRDSDGKPIRATGTHTDITESKQAEEELLVSEEKHRLILDNIPVLIAAIDQTGKYVVWNRYAENMLGYTPIEAIGKIIPLDIHETKADADEVIRVASERGIYDKEIRFKRKDKTFVSARLVVVPNKDSTGKIVGFYGFAEDITERKRAEEALRESEEKYRALIEAAGRAGEGIIIIQDNKEGEAVFISVNDQFCKMSGYSEEELLGRSPWDLIPYEISVRLKDWYKRRHIGESLPGHYEAAGVHKDGTIVPLELSIVTMPWQGNIATVLYIRDITERKKAEEEIRTERDKLENVTRNIGVGLAIVSKDYRTVWANEVLKQIFGEVEGKLCYNTYNGRPDICPGCGVREVFERGKDIAVHEQVGKDKQGETIWSQIIATPLKDKDGNINAAMEVVVPITERKKAEEEIRDLAKFPSENPEPILRISKDGIILYANDSSLSLLNEWRTSVNQPAPDYLRQLITEVTNTGLRRNIEIEHKGRILSFIVVPICDVNYVNLYGRDITEQKQTEEKIKKSAREWEITFNSITDFVSIQDKDFKLLRVNKACTDWFKCKSEELVGRKCYEIFHGTKEPWPTCPHKKTLETRNPITEEFFDPHLQIHLEVSTSPILDEKGEVKGTIHIVKNITERKKAEEALKESEERYRNFFENAPLGIYRTTPDGRILLSNPALLQMLGYSSFEELASRNLEKEGFEPHYSRNKFKESLEKTSEVRGLESAWLRRDGSTIFVRENARAVRNEDGSILYYEGMVEDITERKKTEEALRESEERYRVLFESSAVGILVADIETKEFKYANPALCRMLGYTEDELKQMSVADIHPKEKLEYVISEFDAQARGEKTLIQDISCLRKDGTIIYADINTTKVTLDGREYNAGFFKDVTERKRAEEALKESEQEYRGVVDNIGIGVSLISPNLEILFLNKQMKKWFPNVNISKETICYRAFNSPPREEACSYCPTNKTLQDGQIHESITETPTGDKIINYRVISSPIKDLQGKVIAAIEMVEDITEKKRLQEQLIQTEKLAAVGTLAYGIAHEFNNILAGMMANAELGLISKEREQIKECFEIIVDNSHRASSITNNLLAFAREKEARKELIDITEPLKSVLAITHRELEKHNIEVIEKFRPVPKIYCDPGQFSEVFLNMITNARDAMHPKGGTLTIQVEPAEENIRIVFKDNGCGIPEEIKGRIFEPFVTTKGALGRSEVPGTGLGLFLTYGIINGYKGKIEIETKVGKGTKFSIIIPISENQPPELLPNTRIKSSKETEKKLKILLVDDEKAIILGLKKFLESKGHKVSTSLRAKEGLEIFRKGRFDLVLSDITIPDMDGIELIKKVKEKDPQAKIIVITGHLQKEKEEKAREAGADEVLIKPFKNELLQQTISKVVDWR